MSGLKLRTLLLVSMSVSKSVFIVNTSCSSITLRIYSSIVKTGWQENSRYYFEIITAAVRAENNVHIMLIKKFGNNFFQFTS